MILCYEVINLKKLREQLKTLSKYVNVIFDLTNIDLNTKPILNKVVKKLGVFLTDNTQINNKSMIESGVVNIIEDFKIYYDINVDYSVAGVSTFSNTKT